MARGYGAAEPGAGARGVEGVGMQTVQPVGWAERLLVKALIAIWRRRDPQTIPTRPYSMNPSDNVQVPMNLVMPLADNSPLGRARLIQALATAVPQVIAGLDNTQIVHYGRFDIVDDNLCMFSIYDGDFSNYIRDFVYNVGQAFDALLAFVKDPPPLPVEDHPDEFIDWVLARDAVQLPESITDLGPEDDRDILKLSRRLVLLLDACRRADPPKNLQLFVYRAYPGFSSAQIRHAFKIGW
jgi:hypothetical protein